MSPVIELYGFGIGASFDPGTGSGRYTRACNQVEEWWDGQGTAGEGPGPFAFASFTFDSQTHGSVVIIPAFTLVRALGLTYQVSVEGSVLPMPAPKNPHISDRPRFAGSSLPDHLWLEAVAEVLETITRGEAEKVVLARDHALWSKQPFDQRAILTRLHERFPECFTFLIEGLTGASPELLVRLEDMNVTSQVLAGSAARGDNTEDDELIGKDLQASKKNQLEHALAAASVERVLGEICRRLYRPEAPELLRLDNVQHLATRFTGALSDPRHVLEVVGALHPTAAVGGTPTDSALALIRRLEKMDRGRYAGPVGYFDANGDGEFAIALRCAELSGARARLFAGGGIVAGSVPEEELEETRLKLRAMLSVLDQGPGTRD
ncbi:MAG TPA: isochorismate synthase [Acidimicrobiia bacterium]|nr:isochorismate synthase [Acidimicrobiia bacterium]